MVKGPDLNILVNAEHLASDEDKEYREGVRYALEKDLGIELYLPDSYLPENPEEFDTSQASYLEGVPEESITGIHASFRNNSASSDIDSLEEYIEAVSSLDSEYITIHPPSEEDYSSPEEFIQDLEEISQRTGYKGRILVENMPGTLMSNLEEVRDITEVIDDSKRIGTTLDTDHTEQVSEMAKAMGENLYDIHYQGSIPIPEKKCEELAKDIYNDKKLSEVSQEIFDEIQEEAEREFGLKLDNEQTIGYPNTSTSTIGHIPPQLGEPSEDLQEEIGNQPETITLEVAEQYIRPPVIDSFVQKFE